MALNEARWYRERGVAANWRGAVSGVPHEHDTRDNIRGEMVAEMGTALDIVRREGDWTLKDCEQFSAVLERLADQQARIRASINREAVMQ